MVDGDQAAEIAAVPGDRFRGRPRRAWVIGSGLDVWEIVELRGSYEDDVAALTADHRPVTEQHVRTACAYPSQLADEIAALPEENRRPLSELTSLCPSHQSPRR